jgi:hypothetical protein
MNDRKFLATLVAVVGFACAAALAVDGKDAMAIENLDPSMQTVPTYSQWKDHPGLALVAAQRERWQQTAERTPRQ